MKGTTIAVLSCAFFGLSPIFEKTLLKHMSPLALSALHSLLAGVLLVFLLEFAHKLWEITCLCRRDKIILLLTAGMVGVFGPIFYLHGLKLTSVANTLLIGRSNSLMIALFATILLRERLTVHQVLGSILMISGLIIIFSRGFRFGYEFRIGDIYILIASFFWALSAVLMKKYLQHVPPEVIVVARNFIGGIILLFFALPDISQVEMVWEIPVYLMGLALFGVILAQLLWYSALEHTKASNVGIASISIPIFGSFFAAIFLGETLETYQMIGGGLVLIGLTAMEIHLSILNVGNLKRRLKLRHHLHH
ncbi:MAG TPA: DMT family transporter [Candidatus Altiarchaeales archaeon]|nr:DMT family transporter [Candidatus Altiarchaeales archaeon]